MAENLTESSIDLIKLQRLNRIIDLLQGIALKNILLVGNSPQVKTIVVSNPNLYKLAVQYYGDANLWTIIASANNIIEPKIFADIPIVLLIPPPPTVGTGGLLNPT